MVAFVRRGGSVSLFASVMFLNGWVQGMGWPPSGRILVYWFSTRERGWKTSIWNCAHNVGGAGVGAAAALALEMTGNDWRSAFWFPALIALGVALLTFVLLRDRPEAVGLPPIEEYRDDPAKVEVRDETVQQMGIWGVIRTYILTDRTIMLLAICNVFLYTLRYGVLNWIPIFLHDVRHAEVAAGITGFAVFELAGIIGTLLCGWISDRVFEGYRTGLVRSSWAPWPPPSPSTGFCPRRSDLDFHLDGGDHRRTDSTGRSCLSGCRPSICLPDRVWPGSRVHRPLRLCAGATLASSGVGLMVHHFGWDFTFIALIPVHRRGLILMNMVGKQERALMEAHDLRCHNQEPLRNPSSLQARRARILPRATGSPAGLLGSVFAGGVRGLGRGLRSRSRGGDRPRRASSGISGRSSASRPEPDAGATKHPDTAPQHQPEHAQQPQGPGQAGQRLVSQVLPRRISPRIRSTQPQARAFQLLVSQAKGPCHQEQGEEQPAEGGSQEREAEDSDGGACPRDHQPAEVQGLTHLGTCTCTGKTPRTRSRAKLAWGPDRRGPHHRPPGKRPGPRHPCSYR